MTARKHLQSFEYAGTTNWQIIQTYLPTRLQQCLPCSSLQDIYKESSKSKPSLYECPVLRPLVSFLQASCKYSCSKPFRSWEEATAPSHMCHILMICLEGVSPSHAICIRSVKHWQESFTSQATVSHALQGKTWFENFSHRTSNGQFHHKFNIKQYHGRRVLQSHTNRFLMQALCANLTCFTRWTWHVIRFPISDCQPHAPIHEKKVVVILYSSRKSSKWVTWVCFRVS